MKLRHLSLFSVLFVLTACSTQTVEPQQVADVASSPAQTTVTVTQTPAETTGSDVKPLGEANEAMKTLRPEAPSALVVTDLRVGTHNGFDRVVFEFTGDGQPGWFIDYTDKPTQQASGHAVTVAGDTYLNVNLDGTTYPFEAGIEQPNFGDVQTDGAIVKEIYSGGTFEGRSQFIIGMNGKHPYSVQVLKGPTRVVIDIMQN